MTRRTLQQATGITTAALAALCVGVWVGEKPSVAEQPVAKPGNIPAPIVDTHELMELFNQPLYELLKAEMAKELDTKEHWQTIHDRGLQTAEVANLIAMRQEKPQWRAMSSDLQQAGIELANAAKAKDKARTHKAYRMMIERCNSCHQSEAPDHAPDIQP